MKLIAIEAKDRCLQVWRYIESHIKNPAWRLEVEERYEDSWLDLEGKMKDFALHRLFPGDKPNSHCYLCEYHRIIMAHGSWKGCADCCLSRGENGHDEAPCMYSRRPYASFVLNVESEQWSRAARAAHRLVTVVEQWEPEEE